jgi:GMP synthase-like glutamine amidotransferase
MQGVRWNPEHPIHGIKLKRAGILHRRTAEGLRSSAVFTREGAIRKGLLEHLALRYAPYPCRMKRWRVLMHLLVFQHLAVEHPGILRDFWREAGVEWTAIELDEGEAIPPALDRYDALVVMGGPMDVWQREAHPWLSGEIAAIREFVVTRRRPYLGICLGHQLLAAALGGEVGLAAQSEVGPCPVRLTAPARGDALLEGLASPLTTFQWHSAEVKTLPPEAVVLAETDACHIQAFRYGRCAYGFQFHAEITAETVADWERIPAYRRALEEALGPNGSERLAAQTLALLPEFNVTARRLSDHFLETVRASARLR